MSPGRRHSGEANGASGKSRRRRKNEISIADRLNTPNKSEPKVPPGSVLPGQDAGRRREPTPPPREDRPHDCQARRPRALHGSLAPPEREWSHGCRTCHQGKGAEDVEEQERLVEVHRRLTLKRA